MANWSDLKASVAEVIKINGNQEITGAVLQSTLNSIISNVGANATFAGIATPETNPGTPDGNLFYLATEPGTYANFNGIEIADGEAVILEWRGSWTKKTTGLATQKKLTELESKQGIYNVDANVPLLSGQFYTASTARSAVPASVRKLGMIITYKTDATTSVTEQFLGPSTSVWSTDANWKIVGSDGGNKILEWETDAATTRKKVIIKDRKAGMIISYTPDGTNWINEQYTGELTSNTEWAKDSNWQKIVDEKQIISLKNNEILKSQTTANLTGLFANTYVKESVEYTYKQLGLIDKSGQNVAYTGHSVYCYKCTSGETFYVTHTSYASSGSNRLPITIYKVPKGQNPTRDYLIPGNLMEIVATADNYNPQNKKVVIGDYLDTEDSDLYLCIVYYDGGSGTDNLAVDRATPQSGFMVEQRKKNEEQDRLNKGLESIPLIDAKVNGGFAYINTDFDGNILGKIDTEGNNIAYGNYFSYYKKINSGEKIKYSHTSTSISGESLTYGFYQLPIGEKPARENIISANLLEPYNTSNTALIDKEITAPSVVDKDLYFLTTQRIPGQEGGDTYSLSIYQEVQGYDERIENLEKNQGIRKPFEGKGVYFAGDSNTMRFYYSKKFLETTGMSLIGYTSERGNGATSIVLYSIVKELDEEGTIDWAKIDIFGIFVGGNDYDHNIQSGTFEDSYDIESSPNTRYAAIRMLIEYCQQKAIDAGNNTMIIVAFSRPERDDFLTTDVAKTTLLLENVEYIIYNGMARNSVSDDFPGLAGAAVAQYANDGSFEKALLAPNHGEDKNYSGERVDIVSGKKVRVSFRTSHFTSSAEIHYIGGSTETITKESSGKFESDFQWILTDGTKVKTNNYYRGRRNDAGCTMADIGNQILDCAKRMGCPTCDLHSLSGVTYQNLRYWIPDGTHYGQSLGDRLGVLMGNFINNLQL